MFNVRVFLTNASLASLDLVLTASCLLGLRWLSTGQEVTHGVQAREFFLTVVVVLAIWLTLAAWLGMYRSRRLDTPLADIAVLAKADLALWAVIRLAPGLQPSQTLAADLTGIPFLATHFIVLLAIRSGVRVLLRHVRSRGYDVKRVVLVSSRELGDKLERRIRQRAHYGYHIARRFTLRDEGENALVELSRDVGECLRSGPVDDVILALPWKATQLSLELMSECERLGINVRIVPDLFPLIRADTQTYDLDGVPLVNGRLYPSEYITYAVLKRCFDVLFSLCVLVVCAPLFLFVAVLVKFSSPGPVFFSQRRVGMNGREFRMIKFRTMRHEAALDPDSHWTVRNDSHVTGVGRWLRRLNLDELPQFINVLRGDMSVVGPRPERPFFLDRFRHEVPEYMVRHYVKSGITGWAQVHGWRGDTSIPQRVAHDLYYIRNWAVTLDLKIVALTIARTLFPGVPGDGGRKPGDIKP